jgi:putative DNA-binding phage protein
MKINKIKAYREAIGKSRNQFANLLNVGYVSYSRKENGDVPFKDSEKIILLEYLKEFFPNETIDSLFFN